MRPFVRPLLTVVGLLLIAWPTGAKGPCGYKGEAPTIREKAQEATAVFHAAVGRQVAGPITDDEAGVEFRALDVIKSHPQATKKRLFAQGREIPVKDLNDPPRFILFCDFTKGGEFDPYAGIPAAPALVAYVKQAITKKMKDSAKDLPFFFKHADHEDPVIRADACRELAKCSHADLCKAAKGFDPDKLVGLLQKSKNSTYALLLGVCGQEKHAKVLHDLLNDKTLLPMQEEIILTAYVLLKPKDGWARLRQLLSDPTEGFSRRYGAVRTIRFFWSERPDVVAKKDLRAAMLLVLNHNDVADFAVDDLRKWKQWDLTDTVLKLPSREGVKDSLVVPRAVLRFALQSPARSAAAYVAEQRRQDPDEVKDVEEMLELESAAKK